MEEIKQRIKEYQSVLAVIDFLTLHCYELDTTLIVEGYKSTIETINGDLIPCYRF
jgi:hypothetical protein